MLVLSSIFSIDAKDLSTHYIIGFDQAIGNYHTYYLSPKVLSTLSSVLKSGGYDPGRDYVSMVGYTLEMGQPSMERFVRPYVNSDGDPVKWLSVPDADLSAMFRHWPQGEPELSRAGAPYGSLQSLAKPYIVMAVRSDSDRHADRTIMLLVTDERINGSDDYKKEWEYLSTCPGANSARFSALESRAFAKAKDFNEEFNFIQIPPVKHKSEEIALSPDKRFKIVAYEAVSADKPSIHSVTDFPSSLPLQRVRGGFKLAVDANSTNDKYEIDRISLYNEAGDRLARIDDGHIDLIIPTEELKAGDTIVTAMSLRMKDGFYDGALISSENPRYKNGMTSSQAVKLQDEAKVLGLMPLSDAFWWWFPNDIFTAVMVWDLIILIAVIIVVGYILYRCFVKINTYKPTNDNIKITRI